MKQTPWSAIATIADKLQVAWEDLTTRIETGQIIIDPYHAPEVTRLYLQQIDACIRQLNDIISTQDDATAEEG